MVPAKRSKSMHTTKTTKDQHIEPELAIIKFLPIDNDMPRSIHTDLIHTRIITMDMDIEHY